MGIIVIFWDPGLLLYHSVFHWESSQPFLDSLKTSHWLLRLHFGVVGLVCLCSSVSPACHTNEWTWQSESVAHFGDVCHWSCILAECWTLLRVLSALVSPRASTTFCTHASYDFSAVSGMLRNFRLSFLRTSSKRSTSSFKKLTSSANVLFLSNASDCSQTTPSIICSFLHTVHDFLSVWAQVSFHASSCKERKKCEHC